jgi:16S rRNA (uracil1498-N3)-methyltransferase
MISALTQSGGGWLPEIHPSAPIARAVAASPAANRVLLDANAERTMLSVRREFPMVIALGPEGGFADDERQQMIDGGFTPVRITPAVLRFETAGIAALAVARAMAENLESKKERTSHE